VRKLYERPTLTYVRVVPEYVDMGSVNRQPLVELTRPGLAQARVRAWQIPGYVAPGYRSPRDPGWRAAGGEEGRRGGWGQGSENRRLYKVPE
jgi:hypothetical protein